MGQTLVINWLLFVTGRLYLKYMAVDVIVESHIKFIE